MTTPDGIRPSVSRPPGQTADLEQHRKGEHDAVEEASRRTGAGHRGSRSSLLAGLHDRRAGDIRWHVGGTIDHRRRRPALAPRSPFPTSPTPVDLSRPAPPTTSSTTSSQHVQHAADVGRDLDPGPGAGRRGHLAARTGQPGRRPRHAAVGHRHQRRRQADRGDHAADGLQLRHRRGTGLRPDLLGGRQAVDPAGLVVGADLPVQHPDTRQQDARHRVPDRRHDGRGGSTDRDLLRRADRRQGRRPEDDHGDHLDAGRGCVLLAVRQRGALAAARVLAGPHPRRRGGD